jgi:hypothetical protein
MGFGRTPCDTCARAHEKAHPEDGECWPYPGQDIAALSTGVKQDLADEAKRWAGFGYRDTDE